ncbi:MAG: hypothetical protein HKN16_02285 [Saprospiraceae bacterium]|nr:hypothetical protein [Saprospiraceae bacterium]
MYTGKMKKGFHLVLIAVIILFQGGQLCAQNEKAFPASWEGSWQGDLAIYKGEGLQQTIPMELVIQSKDSTDHYDWWIIYGEDKEAGKRAYELKPVDKEKGAWLVDEKNSILLDCYFFANKLWSRYEVMENLILITNEVNGDEMIFEVISGNLEAPRVTGKTLHEGEEIPEVKAFPISVMQRAKLYRQP